MRLFFGFLVIGAVFFSSSVNAQEPKNALPSSQDEDIVAIYGTACEKIKNDESQASARVRVTDKAGFIAVSDIPDLFDIKEELLEHDFNVMVYDIVDNMVEDMAVRTMSQDSNNICVEMTAFVTKDNLAKAMLDAKNKPAPTAPKEDVKPVEDDKPVENVLPTLEPEILNVLREEQKVDAISKGKALVYVAPVEFFNNTKSANYANLIKNKLINNELVLLTEDEAQAKYVVIPKVLRGKVEAINTDTNRLQMVVSIELKIPSTKASLIEHQNKFVLFSKTDNEQKMAQDLMKSLFEKASVPVLGKIESIEKKEKDFQSMPSVLTPSGNEENIKL